MLFSLLFRVYDRQCVRFEENDRKKRPANCIDFFSPLHQSAWERIQSTCADCWWKSFPSWECETFIVFSLLDFFAQFVPTFIYVRRMPELSCSTELHQSYIMSNTNDYMIVCAQNLRFNTKCRKKAAINDKETNKKTTIERLRNVSGWIMGAIVFFKRSFSRFQSKATNDCVPQNDGICLLFVQNEV